MILTAHQPVYLPWIGLFHKIALADKYCVFDIVQYQTKDYNNRNRIKTNAGIIWLSVPVESKNHLEKKISNIKIIDNGWNKKHFKSIDLAYKKAPYYSKYIDEIEDILIGNKYEFLVDLNMATLNFGLNALNIDIPLIKASDYSFEGVKSDLVLNMCKTLGANHYIFGSQGRNYANTESFFESGIVPHFQEYIHPQYNQINGDFEPYMSIIDLLFNVGPNSFEVIMTGNQKKIKT